MVWAETEQNFLVRFQFGVQFSLNQNFKPVPLGSGNYVKLGVLCSCEKLEHRMVTST